MVFVVLPGQWFQVVQEVCRGQKVVPGGRGSSGSCLSKCQTCKCQTWENRLLLWPRLFGHCLNFFGWTYMPYMPPCGGRLVVESSISRKAGHFAQFLQVFKGIGSSPKSGCPVRGITGGSCSEAEAQRHRTSERRNGWRTVPMVHQRHSAEHPPKGICHLGSFFVYFS